MHAILMLVPVEDDGVPGVPVVESLPFDDLFAHTNHEGLGAVVESMATMALLRAADNPSERSRCASV
jgi:hypothetical protein